MRTLIASLAAAALPAAPGAAAAATPTSPCPQSDRANGLHHPRAGGISCAKAVG
jgi:hypothetical protein